MVTGAGWGHRYCLRVLLPTSQRGQVWGAQVVSFLSPRSCTLRLDPRGGSWLSPPCLLNFGRVQAIPWFRPVPWLRCPQRALSRGSEGEGTTSFSYHYYSAGVLTTHCSLHCLAAHRSPRVNNFYKQDHGCPHTSSSSH